MNHKDYLISRLKSFKRTDVVITDHVRIRLVQRQIDETEVIENIINPKRLEYALREPSGAHAEKYDCYFGYSKRQCHRYVIIIKKKIIVVTVIKINRQWQSIAEQKLRHSR